MSAVIIDGWLRQLIDRTAQQVGRSEQQQRAAQQAGEAVAAALMEVGAEQTILPAIRRELAELRQEIRKAEALRGDLGSLMAPDELDPRGRRALALTAALLKAYTVALDPSSQPNFRGTAEVLTAQTKSQIVRAVSYTVWQYLAEGEAPSPLADAEELP